MYRRPTTQSAPAAITQFIGSDFDTVKLVADNMDMLKALAAGSDATLRYLGVHDTPPATRLDGSPIQAGDYYIDAVTRAMVFYDSSNASWITFDISEVQVAVERATQEADRAEAAANLAATQTANALRGEFTALVQQAEDAADTAATDTVEATKAELETYVSDAQSAAQEAKDASDIAAQEAAQEATDAVRVELTGLTTRAEAAATNSRLYSEDAARHAQDAIDASAFYEETATELVRTQTIIAKFHPLY